MGFNSGFKGLNDLFEVLCFHILKFRAGSLGLCIYGVLFYPVASASFLVVAGYWFSHCHFLYHLVTGMSLVLQVGETSDYPPVLDGFSKCGNFTPQVVTNWILWTSPDELWSPNVLFLRRICVKENVVTIYVRIYFPLSSRMLWCCSSQARIITGRSRIWGSTQRPGARRCFMVALNVSTDSVIRRCKYVQKGHHFYINK